MDWPFLARTTEIETLSRIAAASAPGGGLVVGPRGVGKTTLLREVAGRLDGSGVPTRWIVGSESDRRIDFSSVGGLLASAPDSRTLRTSDVHRAVFAEMSAVPVGQRVCVFVDNGHLIDESSASLLHKLADSGSITVILAARSLVDTGPAVHALWAGGRLRQIHLSPMGGEEVAGVLTSVLGSAVHPLTRAQLLAAVDGIPLVLREIIAGSLDEGHLDEVGGWWRLRNGWEASERVGEAAAYAFGEVDEDTRELLEILALSGPLELTAFERLGSLAAVEELERRRLLRVVPDRSRAIVEFSHSLTAGVLVAAMQMVRRRRLAATAADVVADLGERRVGDHFRIASIRLQAGTSLPADVALSAAQWALEQLRGEEALRLAEAAGGSESFESRFAQAQAFALLGQQRRAEESLHHAQRLVKKRRQRARCSVLAMRILSAGSGGWTTALEVGRRAARELEGSRSGAEVQEEIDRYLVRLGGGDLGGKRSSGGAARAARSKSTESSNPAALLAGLEWHVQRGSFDQAIQLANRTRVRRPSGSLGSFLAHHQIVWYQVLAHALRGELDRARDLARARLDDAVRRQSLPLIGAWSAWLGRVLLLQGRAGEAVDRFGDALVILDENDPFAVSVSTRSARAVAHLHLGRVEEALEDLERTMTAGIEVLADREAQGRAQRWFDVATGHAERAAERAAETTVSLAASGHLALAMLAGHDAVRFGHGDLVAAVMDSSAVIDGDLFPTLAAHAAAARAGDPEQLAAVGESFESCGALLLAAEAFTQSSHEHAERNDRVGERKSAERALLLRSELGDVQTPALTRDAGVLTPREAEIARLAADGETSKRIAERLAISSRTVDNHLASVYTKLGIRGREQLGSVLGTPAD